MTRCLWRTCAILLILTVSFSHLSHTDIIFYYPMDGNLSSDWYWRGADASATIATSSGIASDPSYCPQETSACWAGYVETGIEHIGFVWSLRLLTQSTVGYTNIELSYQMRTVDTHECILDYDTGNGWKTIQSITTPQDIKDTFYHWDPPPNGNHTGIQLQLLSWANSAPRIQSCAFNEFKLTGERTTEPTLNPIEHSTQKPTPPLPSLAGSDLLSDSEDGEDHANAPAFVGVIAFAQSTVGLILIIGTLVCLICALNCVGIYLIMKRRKRAKRATNRIWSDSVIIKEDNVEHHPISSLAQMTHTSIAHSSVGHTSTMAHTSIVHSSIAHSSIAHPSEAVNGARNVPVAMDIELKEAQEEQYVIADDTGGDALHNDEDDSDSNSDDDVMSEGAKLTTVPDSVEIADDYKEEVPPHMSGDGDSDHSNDALTSYPNTRNIMTDLLGSQSISIANQLVAANDSEDDDNVLLNYVISRSPAQHGKDGRHMISTEDIGEALALENGYD